MKLWWLAFLSLVVVLPAVVMAILAFTGEGGALSPLTAAPPPGGGDNDPGVVLEDQTLSLAPIAPKTLLANGDQDAFQIPEPVEVAEKGEGGDGGLLQLDELHGLGLAPLTASSLLGNPTDDETARPRAVPLGAALQLEAPTGLPPTAGGGLGLAPISPGTLLGNADPADAARPQAVSVQAADGLEITGGEGLALARIPAGTLLANDGEGGSGGGGGGSRPPSAFGPLQPWSLLMGGAGAGGGGETLAELAIGPAGTVLGSAQGELRWLPATNPFPQTLPFSVIDNAAGFWQSMPFSVQNTAIRFSQLSIDTGESLTPWQVWFDVVSRVTQLPTVLTGFLSLDMRPYTPAGYSFAPFNSLDGVKDLSSGVGYGSTFPTADLDNRTSLRSVYGFTTFARGLVNLQVNAPFAGREDNIVFTVPMNIMLQKD